MTITTAAPRRSSHAPIALLAAVALAALAVAPVAAQEEAVPFDSPRWRVEGEGRVEEHLGRRALRLQGGRAVLAGVELRDGVIEVDVAFGPERGFTGVLWRRQGPGEHEELYLRPHQSGNPDANQYTPSFHGITSWQLYHGPAYGVAIPYRFDAWQRLKVVFAGGRAAFHLDSAAPVLVVPETLREPVAGGVGVFASAFAPGWFSDFRVRPLRPGEGVPAGGTAAPEAPPGSVLAWEVSTAFDGTLLDGRLDLPAELAAGLRWTPLAADRTGIANLARVQGIDDGRDTAVARVAVEVAERSARRVRFGYSDDVKVYLDGRLLYAGSNAYLSRDYRYLGTIGLFDEVFLDLAPGRHELAFAVRERFGGWGIQATIEDL